MSDNQPHLAALLQRSSRVTTSEEEPEESLPDGDAAYAPHARRSNKAEFSLHFITAAGTMRSFQYAHLDSDSSYTAECVTLRFMGMVPQKVVILGRNLRQLYDHIHHHRMLWVREAARPFAADDETIVTNVRIEPVKENGEKSEQD